ncbi:CoA-disulfide reductase [Endozoicomonas sp. SCSIO W0465]|uniref:CoA-disulfide reductase n=1 Tax=Endozoicomonas sp. SCSIO W0465 TaxID=2918516 RepID=UPI002075748F|nr:CoA-disulfide reductase [Endozoicomonas sp. SCSIO W0465]USE37183.1 CoA-disulfide reductase [Endozoicomonas sp. SCSIO W0465]
MSAYSAKREPELNQSTTSESLRIVIIGGEAAGMSAAAKARRVAREATITVYEQSDVISFGACGLPYYVGDFFSDAGEMSEFSPEQFAARGITVRTRHQVTQINAKDQMIHVHNLTTGEHFEQPYDRLLIATGAEPVIPPVPGLKEGLNNGRVFCVKTMKDGIDLKQAITNPEIREVAIIGAGYIGLEMAEALERQGKTVRIIESASYPLARTFDQEVAEWVIKTLDKEGIQCHWQESVKSLSEYDLFEYDLSEYEKPEDEDHRLLLTTDKGQYRADLVVLCTGVRPNTRFVSDSLVVVGGTGLEMLDNGAIVTDDQGRTNLPNIFSAGDCATVIHGQLQKPVWIPLATYANKMGRLVGEVMGGLDKHFPGAYGAACVKVLSLEAGRVGLGEQEAQEQGIDYQTVVIKDKDHTNYYPGQSDILVKLVYETASKKLLGGQIAGGRGAVLRVDALVAAIKGGLTTDDLGMMDFCYAPPFARTWDALNVAGNVAR